MTSLTPFDKSVLALFENSQSTKLVFVIRQEEDTLDLEGGEDRYITVKVSIFTLRKEGYQSESFKTEIRKLPLGSLRTMKQLIIKAINKQLLVKGDKVMCVVHENVGIGYKGIVFFFDIDHILFTISQHNLSARVPANILEAIIDIASEIADEGREGKKIGTMFIIGDKNELMKYVKQLVINPFLGYHEHNVNISDPVIRETVKEFAQLDGSFILDSDGTIITSCAYVDVSTDGIEHLQGFGTRHRTAAAMTKQTDCLAVVVSSSGSIRVFKDGHIVMKL
ncbi:MAG: diadenylate cyclase [Nanoarchaeota archaeon]